jgi:uncharacterized membrane protein
MAREDLGEFIDNDLDHDPIWHVEFTVVLALLLQLLLPERFVVGPRFVVPILEALLVISLFITSRKTKLIKARLRKFSSVTLIVLIAIANAYALQSLAHQLLGGNVQDGQGLILTAINIFFTNIIVFGLLYWEIDAGGPVRRRKADRRKHDFSFPQMQNPELAPHGWIPNFIDYLYVSATNATAFSPTDTMPLTRVAKLFMLTQSLISLTTLALVAARAVNILK